MTTQLQSLAQDINVAHEACVAAMQSSIERARQCGDLLIAAKQQLGHGKWLSWLDANCTVGPRMAQRYMRIARHWAEFGRKNDTVSHLPIRRAIEMLAVDEPTTVEQWIERLNDRTRDEDWFARAAFHADLRACLRQLESDTDELNSLEPSNAAVQACVRVRDNALAVQNIAAEARVRSDREAGSVLATLPTKMKTNCHGKRKAGSAS